jgi:hypothetical protein
MDTLTAIRDGKLTTPLPMQALFGAGPIDAEIIEVSILQPRWDEPEIDDVLVARCSSL